MPEFPPLVVDGVRCRVTNLFDVDGDEMSVMPEDPADVYWVVASHPNGTWISQEVGPEMWSSTKEKDAK